MYTLQFDFDKRIVLWGKQEVNLTSGEFRVMALLVRRPGSYSSYREIYDALRGIPGFHAGDGVHGMQTNVRSCIKRIRRKFEAIDPGFDGIMNSSAYGYGLHRSMIAPDLCCPTCGQVVIAVPETVLDGPPPRRGRPKLKRPNYHNGEVVSDETS